MSLLFRYIFQRHARLLLLIMCLGLGLYLLTDIVERVDVFIDNDAGFDLVIKYFGCRIPGIVALIVPNMDALDKAGIGADGLDAVMKQNITFLNSKLPAYSAVNDFELRFEPFSKTPKGSIRRFMYK
jgi:hypothetical protein